MNIRPLLLALGFWMVGCGAIAFDVDGSIGEQQVPGDPLGGLLGDIFQPIPLQIDVNAALDAQNVSVIQGIFLKDIVLSITATDNGNGDDNFDFIQQIDMFASAPNRADLPRVQVANATNNTPGAATFTIVGIEDVNLKDYVEAGMEIEAEVTGNAPPTDTSFDGVVTVTVEAL